jgi:predicted nucleic acid-binding protein
MSSFALDANCMVATVSSWHEHHAAASREIERRFERGERLTVPAPALIEAYAVLTRLPPPHRLSPTDAWTLLDVNFVKGKKVVVLRGATYRALLRRLAKEGIAGGRTYDAVIGECARQGRVQALLTFNTRHFDPPPPGVTIVEPGASA